jgi:hypothetical protein
MQKKQFKRWQRTALAVLAGGVMLQNVYQSNGCAQFATTLGLGAFNFCSVLNCTSSAGFFNLCEPQILLIDCPNLFQDGQ